MASESVLRFKQETDDRQTTLQKNVYRNRRKWLQDAIPFNMLFFSSQSEWTRNDDQNQGLM